MGAANVLAAYRLYAGKIPQTSMVVLAYMAVVSLDRDPEPEWWEGHSILAVRCFGYSEPIGRAGHGAVERAITPLFRAGAITVTRHAFGSSGRKATVRYRLWLTEPAPHEKRGVLRPAPHGKRGVLRVAPHENRGTKEELKRGGPKAGARYLNGPDLTGTGGRGSAASGHNHHRQEDHDQELAEVVPISSRTDPPGLFWFGVEHDHPESPWAGIMVGERYDEEDTFGVLGRVSA